MGRMDSRLYVAATKHAGRAAQTSVRRRNAIDRSAAVAATQATIGRPSIKLDRCTNCGREFDDTEKAPPVSRLLLLAPIRDHTTAGVDARVSANCCRLILCEQIRFD